MPNKITDIRTSNIDQLTTLTNLIIEVLPDDCTPQFVIAGKLNAQDEFILDMFYPAILLPDNFKQRIICAISESQIRNLFNTGRFRLDDFEAYPTEKPLFYYTVTYFK